MKKSILLLAVLIIFGMQLQNVYSAGKEGTIEVTENIHNAVFSISWEKSVDTDVTLTKPDGTELTQAILKNNYLKKKNKVEILITNPPKGAWKVKVLSDGVGKVTAEVFEALDTINISKFNVTKLSNDKYKFDWEITGIKDTAGVTIFADKNNEGLNGTKIAEAKSGAKGSTEVQISNLNNGDYYCFMEAKDKKGIFDYKYAQNQIKFINSNIPVKLKNVKLDIIDNTFSLKWDKAETANFKSYRILYFKAGEASPFNYTDINNIDITQYTSEEIPANNSNIEVGVAVVDDKDLVGNYDKFKPNFSATNKMDVRIDFPKGKYINLKRIEIPIKINSKLTAKLYINGKLIRKNIKKSGNMILNLEDGQNEIAFIVKDKLHNEKRLIHKYYVDTYPPQLNLIKNYQGINTDSSYVMISGDVEPNSKLFINNKKVDFDEDGIFSYKLSLSLGNNAINIKAVDLAGNETHFYGKAKRVIGYGFVYKIILGAVCVAAIAFMIFLFIRKRAK